MPFVKGQSGNPSGKRKQSAPEELPRNPQAHPKPESIVLSPVEMATERDPEASPISGVVPPVQHRFMPGHAPLPGAGRAKNAGASIREWVNTLAAQNLNEREIRQIARDKDCPYTKREAAIRILRSLEDADIADYEPALLGKGTLSDLRESGLNTTLVKRMKIKTKTYGKEGNETEEVERELELHDRGLKEAEWIVCHTDGKATQRVEVIGPPVINLTINIPGMRYLPPTIPTTPALPAGAA